MRRAFRTVDTFRGPGQAPPGRNGRTASAWSGRFRRKKQMWHEMMGDVPGSEIGPRPFLGRRTSHEGPTTHLLGVPRPAVRAIHAAERPRRHSGEHVQLAQGPATVPWLPRDPSWLSNPPRHPVEGVRDPEGFAFTAVSPFY